MTRYEYDDEASERLHMDVVHEFDDRPTPVARWVSAMRLLNSINDPLARKIWLFTATVAPVTGSATHWRTSASR